MTPVPDGRNRISLCATYQPPTAAAAAPTTTSAAGTEARRSHDRSVAGIVVARLVIARRSPVAAEQAEANDSRALPPHGRVGVRAQIRKPTRRGGVRARKR